MNDKKFKVGSAVLWDDPTTQRVRQATVVRHGRDMSGVYTEVRAEDGERYRVHRSYLKTGSVSQVL